jgi:hypothetical protein
MQKLNRPVLETRPHECYVIPLGHPKLKRSLPEKEAYNQTYREALFFVIIHYKLKNLDS